MSRKWDFRDVSSGLRIIREFLLGRKYVFHHRYLPLIAPRSIPPPDVPRGEYKYSDQYYGKRDVLNSVKPPVVAPVAEGFKSGAKTCCPQRPGIGQSFKFPSELPTPGCVWWFDAHCYYVDVGEPVRGIPPHVPCNRPAPPPPCPGPPPQDEHPVEIGDPCAVSSPCKLEPCKTPKLPQQPEICDPCKEEKPKKKC